MPVSLPISEAIFEKIENLQKLNNLLILNKNSFISYFWHEN
jgi:hypothetical protein